MAHDLPSYIDTYLYLMKELAISHSSGWSYKMVLNSSESELAMQQEEMAIGQNLGLNTLNEKAQGFN